MKITNTDKFRQDIYKAIKDIYFFGTETSAAMWKGDFDDFKPSMAEHFMYDDLDGRDTWEVISLPQPLQFTDYGFAITVTDDEIIIWDTTIKTHYDRLRVFYASAYSSRLAIAMALCKEIEALCNR